MTEPKVRIEIEFEVAHAYYSQNLHNIKNAIEKELESSRFYRQIFNPKIKVIEYK